MGSIVKNIVIVNQDAGYLTIDIANAFVDVGFNVSLIAGRLVVRNNPLQSCIDNKKIIQYNRKNYFSRLYSWIVAFFQIIVILRKEYKGAQLLIITNPPFATFIPFFVSNRYSIVVFDYYVDILNQILPWKKWSVINRIWRTCHYKSFNNANEVFVLTDGMKSKVENFCNRFDVKIMELWADVTEQNNATNENSNLLLELNIAGKFLISYSGNIGYSSGVEHLLSIAEQLVEDPDIMFLIMGEGALKLNTKEEIRKRKLTNCHLLTWQIPSVYSQILLKTNLAFVSLRSQDSNDSIPSKLFTYIAYKLPILCVADKSADVSVFVSKYEIGKSFTENQTKEAVQFVLDMKNNEMICEKILLNLLNVSKNHTNKNTAVIVDAYA